MCPFQELVHVSSLKNQKSNLAHWSVNWSIMILFHCVTINFKYMSMLSNQLMEVSLLLTLIPLIVRHPCFLNSFELSLITSYLDSFDCESFLRLWVIHVFWRVLSESLVLPWFLRLWVLPSIVSHPCFLKSFEREFGYLSVNRLIHNSPTRSVTSYLDINWTVRSPSLLIKLSY